MKLWLLTALVAGLVCVGSAKRGSISDHLLESDTRDDEPDAPEETGERMNPCARKKCHRGELCRLDEAGEAECACAPNCEPYQGMGERYKVCSNKNDTYATACDLDRMHCLCKCGLDGCHSPGVKKIQLDYYGQCQEMKECSDTSMAQFPGRLRDWLFVVMETMAARADIGEYTELLESAKSDVNHTHAALWGFCDLDKDPQDRKVSRRELQYTVRTLRALEHCLLPFLDSCDADEDRRISLPEWGDCLGVPHDKITDQCMKIHKSRGKRNNRQR